MQEVFNRMLPSKHIAAALLLTYAVPAALGPGWHVHEHQIGGHGCQHELVDASREFGKHACDGHPHCGAMATVARPAATHTCCGGHGKQVRPLASPQRGDSIGQVSWDDAHPHHSGNCMICNFYASGYIFMPLDFGLHMAAVSASLLTATTVRSEWLLQAWFARGPPALYTPAH
jgi:hypothetical protein